MKGPHRRQFLRLAASAAALPVASRNARAQTYPSRPVRIVVGLPAGGSPDMGARLIAQWLSERLAQQFFVDNRPGASTNIGTEAVVRADPDGHTLLLALAANAVNATLYGHLKFNFARDIAPVAGLLRVPNVMEVHPAIIVTRPGTFVLLSGKPTEYRKAADSGNVRPQGFCPQCGTALYSASIGDAPKAYNVRIGALRQRNELVPRRQAFACSQHAWVNNLNSIPKFDKMPPSP